MNDNDLLVPDDAGELLTEYETGSGYHWFIILFAPLLAGLFIGIWIYLLIRGDAKDLSAGFIVGSIILLGIGGAFLAGFILALSALRWRLELYSQGLLLRKPSSARWLSWEDVKVYYEHHIYMNGISMGHILDLRLKSGKKMKLEQIFKNSAVLADEVKQCLIPAMVAEAESAIRANEAVDYKHIKVTKDGLQTPKEFIAWKDVGSVGMEDNKGIDFHLVGRSVGRKPWLDVAVTSFPSVDVFLLLVDRMRRPQ